MALQVFGVNDANPAHASVLGMTYNGTDTVTATSNVVATALTTTGTLTIPGTQHINGNLSVNTDKFNVTAATGATNIAGDLAVNTNKFTVNSSTGAVHVAGDISGEAFLLANAGMNISTLDIPDLQVNGTATISEACQMWYSHALGAQSNGVGTAIVHASLNRLYDGWTMGSIDFVVNLADGLPGQLKVITLEERALNNDMYIQPQNRGGFTWIKMNAAHQHAFLLFTGGVWRIILTSGEIIV